MVDGGHYVVRPIVWIDDDCDTWCDMWPTAYLPAWSAATGGTDKPGKREEKRRSAHALFLAGRELKDTPGQLYLESRGIDFARLGRIPTRCSSTTTGWRARERRAARGSSSSSTRSTPCGAMPRRNRSWASVCSTAPGVC